jgi:hypothetical protein
VIVLLWHVERLGDRFKINFKFIMFW